MLTFFRITLGPLLLLISIWFHIEIVPTLSPQMQHEIEYGIFGAFVGFYNGLIVFRGFVESWKSVEELLIKYKIIKKQSRIY